MIDRKNVTLQPLNLFLTEYKELNIENLYRPVAVGRYGIRTRESIYSKELAKDYSKNKVIQKGTLTVGMGSVQMDIGILSTDEKYSVSPAYHTYRISGINYDYLRYCLQCRNMDMFARFVKRGSRQGKSIDLDRWVTYEIPVYSEDIQLEIVDRLNKVQNIIGNRLTEMQKLDELIRARFVEMFGDPEINPKGYPVQKLSEYITFLTSGSRGWAKYCVDEGKEWFITIKNVKDCHITTDNMQPVNAPNNAEARRTRVQEGDLLISITADLGRTGVVTKEIADHGAYINQHLTCIRLNSDVVEPLYVSYFMESPAGKKQFASKNQTAVKAGLNFNSINTLKLLVPPKEDQKAFLEFVAEIDKLKESIRKSLAETKTLFDSLMQQYFG